MSSLPRMFRDSLRASPVVFPLIGRQGESPDFERRVVRPGDSVVIEGYPRSGNTFGTMAFRRAQLGPLNIGNHFHAPAQILLANRYAIPALVVIRAPKAAALSLCVYHGGRMSAARAVELYIAFHRPILRIPQAWTPALFEEVIADFAPAIRRMNAQFGTNFIPYENSPEEDALTRAAVEKKRLSRLAKRGDMEASIARQTVPSAEKEALKSRYRDEFETVKVRRLLSAAQDYYESILNHKCLKQDTAVQ
ncbi:hypothetical protein [Pseudooceanicola sp. HF7]|uniref:hypothetical protein n=1 Tax=Pseudooceanicola sp. HF7 TaxID=2721560 RepID=UPI0014305F90|nr:hypothetical protein [Pseudooceanicola sp. HF7]NIZ10954.1 hypothetical protein [Pseudooceanicola sp. HF7]